MCRTATIRIAILAWPKILSKTCRIFFESRRKIRDYCFFRDSNFQEIHEIPNVLRYQMFLQKTYILVILLRKMFELLSAINENLKSESDTECSIIGKSYSHLKFHLALLFVTHERLKMVGSNVAHRVIREKRSVLARSDVNPLITSYKSCS